MDRIRYIINIKPVIWSKPMSSVGQGAHELRVKDREGNYRTFYYSKQDQGILVFHCFKKKSAKTPVKEIRQGMKYLKEML